MWCGSFNSHPPQFLLGDTVRMKTKQREKEVLEKSLAILVGELAPKKIYLFGSRAKERAQAASDFDFGLDCAPPTVAKKREIREKLEKVAGLYTIDLIFLSEVEAGFRDLVLKTGKVIDGQK